MTKTRPRTSRPWAQHEDNLLRQAVAKYGNIDAWKRVASLVPGRDNKSCRKRWLHSLDPTLKKTAWAPEEDAMLLQLYDELGGKWSKIAREIPGRTDDACSKRYREALSPAIKKGPWTGEEEAALQKVCLERGHHWRDIGIELGRGALDCRNKMRTIENKLKSHHLSAPKHSEALPDRPPESPLGFSPTLATLPVQTDAESNVLTTLDLTDTSYYPPYYPLETYPPHLQVPSPNLQTLTEPAPPLSPVSPEAAPFQYSSSSLHLALSEPLRSRPLPSESLEHTQGLDALFPSLQCQSQPQSYSSSPLLYTEHDAMGDITMSHADDFSFPQPPSGLLLQGLNFNAPLRTLPFPFSFSQEPSSYDTTLGQTISPISPSGLSLPGHDMWRSPRLPAPYSPYDHSPSVIQTGMTFASEISDDVSSVLSTPATTSVPASVINSPLSPTTTELAGNQSEKPATYDSLLFSIPVPDSLVTRNRKRPPKQPGEPPRLSSTLNFSSDPTIRPYVCAHASCTSPEDANRSTACFTNSRDLAQHVKERHTDGDESKQSKESLFRCGLDGCGRRYSALNGLQYHLQLAPVHFEKAISSQRPTQVLEEPDIPKKRAPANKRFYRNSSDRYVCKHPNCDKTYSQKSGIRYHLDNHHKPRTTPMPAQLPEVPPMLKQRLRNMREAGISSSSSASSSSYPQ